ncbi:MAG: hypothetical protein HZA08_11640 [Nitrospirae bacterium]|nr:hypothetical protein [Nitrospirota bacterium]
MRKQGLIPLCIGVLICIIWTLPVFAQHEIKTVAGVRVMLGVISVQEIKEHPEKHHAIRMHGGPGGTHHLLIHLEDEKTGKEITNAFVTVTVHDPMGRKIIRKLDPMKIDGITDYGNYFDLSDLGKYHIEALIRLEKGETREAFFIIEREPGH